MSTAKSMMDIVTAIWKVLPRKAQWVIGVFLVIWLGWSYLFQERHGGASIVVHSVINRPITYVYVNGNMGSNTFAFDGFNAGGGGIAGPYRIEGNTVKIEWLLSATEDQMKNEGLHAEKHSITLPMPKRGKNQNDFCVLMLPDNTPFIRWAKSCAVEMEPLVDKYRTWR